MERTLIRNLSDHLGNNLLHILCRHGHVTVLPWLAHTLGPELDSALSDENKQGLTPINLAIKVTQVLEKYRVNHLYCPQFTPQFLCLCILLTKYFLIVVKIFFQISISHSSSQHVLECQFYNRQCQTDDGKYFFTHLRLVHQ